MAKPKKQKKKTRAPRKRAATPPAAPGNPSAFTFGNDSGATPKPSNVNQIAPKLIYKISGTPVLPLSRPKG